MLLIQAMPAAAAVPRKYAVGIAQKVLMLESTPAATSDSASRLGTTRVPVTASSASPQAVARSAPTTCHRRSPVRSECRPQSSMLTPATPQGIVASNPTRR